MHDLKKSPQNKVGSELSPEEIKTCVSVLKAGGAVNSMTASQELPRAVMVAIVRAGDEIVGVGAIKQQRPSYARRLASNEYSGFAFDPKMHELGYVAVLEAHRGGKAGRIVNSLLKRFKGPLWATTSNRLMKSTLKHRGFVRRGKGWTGKDGNKLSLWIRSV